MMTGNLATKVQEKSSAPESSIRGPAAMAQARKRVPQDVLDLIALSGVDQEVAINEYLQQGSLGKTKNWDHEEVMKQLEAVSEPAKKSEAIITKEVVEEPKKVEAVKEPVKSPRPSEAQIEKEKEIAPEPAKLPEPIVIKKEVPIEQVIPSPVKENKIEEEKQSLESPAAQTPQAKVEPKAITVSKIPVSTKPTTVVNDETSAFNAASLPAF